MRPLALSLRRAAGTAMEPPLPLSPGEVASFKRDGVLVRRGCIPTAHCAAVRDQLWGAR